MQANIYNYVQCFFSLPRHCGKCQFDLCETCSNPQRSTLHFHELYKANTELIYSKFGGAWYCDECQKRFDHQEKKFSNHCSDCEFDLCDTCMKKPDGTGKKLVICFCIHGKYDDHEKLMHKYTLSILTIGRKRITI